MSWTWGSPSQPNLGGEQDPPLGDTKIRFWSQDTQREKHPGHLLSWICRRSHGVRNTEWRRPWRRRWWVQLSATSLPGGIPKALPGLLENGSPWPCHARSSSGGEGIHFPIYPFIREFLSESLLLHARPFSQSQNVTVNRMPGSLHSHRGTGKSGGRCTSVKTRITLAGNECKEGKATGWRGGESPGYSDREAGQASAWRRRRHFSGYLKDVRISSESKSALPPRRSYIARNASFW